MRVVAPALVGLAVLFAGCAHAPGDPANPILRPTADDAFTMLYSQNCAACHGPNGQNGPSIDLANPEYQALIDDATLRKWISGGMPGTEMPAFAQSEGGMLTDAQISALIAGMRKHWQRSNAFNGATPPPYAQSQSGDPRRGEQTYNARCAGCHATSLQQQVTSPTYLALIGDQALRTIIIAGRPDIDQPDWLDDGPSSNASSPLSAQDVTDIVTYLASLRSPSSVVAALQLNPSRR